MTNLNLQKTFGIGQQHLTQLDPVSNDVKHWKSFLTRYRYSEENPDDICIWLACILALKAVNAGNFGVGSILIDSEGEIMSQGHNEVFKPYFHSDRHAEMVVMDRFEDDNPDLTGLDGYTLFSSLEPCPMCLVRLSTTRLSNVLYGALDKEGGMVSRINDLPPFWFELTENKSFRQAACSQELVDASWQIFDLTADDLISGLKSND